MESHLPNMTTARPSLTAGLTRNSIPDAPPARCFHSSAGTAAFSLLRSTSAVEKSTHRFRQPCRRYGGGTVEGIRPRELWSSVVESLICWGVVLRYSSSGATVSRERPEFGWSTPERQICQLVYPFQKDTQQCDHAKGIPADWACRRRTKAWKERKNWTCWRPPTRRQAAIIHSRKINFSNPPRRETRSSRIPAGEYSMLVSVCHLITPSSRTVHACEGRRVPDSRYRAAT